MMRADSASGVVYLVGGGPGDPGLITDRARRLLEEADVVVYDRLVSPQLLALPKASAQMIYVGKQAGHHALPQEGINRLLVRHALLGQKVVRLKGGDPLVFGRGGEEALALRQARVRFEVIPGVTSATAVPAYAGIPVTHRHVATSFHVVTGHECVSRENSKVDWSVLADQSTTLVVLMGMAQLNIIARNLIFAGRREDTPVAVVSSGTRADQTTEIGTLRDFAGERPRDAVKSPGLIVIGDVVSLRPTLSWFEDRMRFRERILVLTQLQGEADEIKLRYEDEGAEVLALSLEPFAIPILSLIDEIQEQLLSTHSDVTCVFERALDALHFFSRLRGRRIDVRRLAHVQFAATDDLIERVIMEYGLTSIRGAMEGAPAIPMVRVQRLFRLGPVLGRIEQMLDGFDPGDWTLAPESTRTLDALAAWSEPEGQGVLRKIFRMGKDIGA